VLAENNLNLRVAIQSAAIVISLWGIRKTHQQQRSGRSN
jgi:hypothetical protein